MDSSQRTAHQAGTAGAIRIGRNRPPLPILVGGTGGGLLLPLTASGFLLCHHPLEPAPLPPLAPMVAIPSAAHFDAQDDIDHPIVLVDQVFEFGPFGPLLFPFAAGGLFVLPPLLIFRGSRFSPRAGAAIGPHDTAVDAARARVVPPISATFPAHDLDSVKEVSTVILAMGLTHWQGLFFGDFRPRRDTPMALNCRSKHRASHDLELRICVAPKGQNRSAQGNALGNDAAKNLKAL